MKKSSAFIFLLAICASLAMLTACEYDMVVPERIAPPPPPDSDTISFVQDIIPIFNAKCVSCHAGSLAPKLTAANAFASLTAGNFVVADKPAESVLYTKCAPGGSMAQYTSASELSLISRWIAAGAKNN